MTQYKSIIHKVLPLGFLIITGCKKFGDTNVNPNESDKPVTSALLTKAQVSLANVGMPGSMSYYVQYYSQVQYPDFQLYTQTNVGWDEFYAGTNTIGSVMDLKTMIDVNTANPDPAALAGNTKNQIQIARIMKAYYFMALTDRYGDIPYSNALAGLPKIQYDKQQDIYNDLFKELKEAVAGFESTGSAVKGDVIFDGDIAKWKAFANSLRMVLAMNLSKVDANKSKTEFVAALQDASGYIKNNSGNFALQFPGGTYNNPFYNLTGASELALSGTIASKLNAYNDPRVFAYGEAVGGKVKGVPYGFNRANNLTWLNANPDYSKAYAVNFKKASSTATIFPAAYTYLLRAEAQLRYNTGEDAYALLRDGVQRSFEQWAVTGDAAAYLAAQGISSAADVTLENIQEQKWIALFGSSLFAWNEWRRTGLPALIPAPDALNASKKIPRRFGYPTTEPNLNGEAYNSAVAAMPYSGGDTHDNRVWWDKP
jgi:hypothetical protein